MVNRNASVKVNSGKYFCHVRKEMLNKSAMVSWSQNLLVVVKGSVENFGTQ